jgi:hypothetical protein
LPRSTSSFGSRHRCFICCPAGSRKRSSRELKDLGTNLTPCRNKVCSALPFYPLPQSRALRRRRRR